MHVNYYLFFALKNNHPLKILYLKTLYSQLFFGLHLKKLPLYSYYTVVAKFTAMIPAIVIYCTVALVIVAILILFAGHRNSVGIRCGAIFAIIVFIIQLGVCFALLTVSARYLPCFSSSLYSYVPLFFCLSLSLSLSISLFLCMYIYTCISTVTDYTFFCLLLLILLTVSYFLFLHTQIATTLAITCSPKPTPNILTYFAAGDMKTTVTYYLTCAGTYAICGRGKLLIWRQ